MIVQLDESVFMTSDIRGTYPEQLNEDFAFVLGRGLARVLGARRVTLARDGRASSPTLYAATAAGLRHEGVEVRTLDLAALELLYHVMGEAGGGELGVMVTASHNPAEFNGFKIVAPGALLMGERSAVAGLPRWMKEASPPRRAHWDVPEKTVSVEDEYMDLALRVAGTPEARGLKVVVDPGGGVGGLLWGRLAEATGLEPIRMNFQPDGRFPDHLPDPSKMENLTALRERVLAERADLGLAYDGDADRVVAVLRNGHILDGSEVIVAMVERLLGGLGGRGGRFAVNMMIRRGALEHFRARGIEPLVVPVGHAKIRRIMQGDPSLGFAGEQSGHYFHREFFCCESSIITTLHILHMAAEGRLEALADGLPGPWVEPERWMSFPFDRKDRAVEVCRAVALAGLEMFPAPQEVMCEIDWKVVRHCGPEDIKRSDGVRVDYADSWFCVRPSCTEPLARLWVEARSRADQHAKEAALASHFPGYVQR